MTPEQALAATGAVTEGASVVSELTGGPASHSYLVERDVDRWVLRIDTPTAVALGLDRVAEAAVLAQVCESGLGPRPEFVDTARGIQLTRYIDGRAWTVADLNDERNITRLARLLKRLHGIHVVGEPFALREKVLRYAAGIGSVDADALAAEVITLLSRLEITDAGSCLCHNDLVCTNVIDGDRLYLIDWEYAATGDPFFDLATIVEHHGLTDYLADRLLQDYHGTVTVADRERLTGWRQLYRRVVTLWEVFVAQA